MMNKNKILRTTIEILLITTIALAIIIPTLSAYTIQPGYNYTIGNITYGVNTPMDFSEIRYNDSCVIFNNTGFNGTSPVALTITLTNLNTSTKTAGLNDTLLIITANLASGSTNISISGLQTSRSHTIYRNNNLDHYQNSNSSGCINITITAGATDTYTIYRGTKTATTPSDDTPESDDDDDDDVLGEKTKTSIPTKGVDVGLLIIMGLIAVVAMAFFIFLMYIVK